MLSVVEKRLPILLRLTCRAAVRWELGFLALESELAAGSELPEVRMSLPGWSTLQERQRAI